MADSAEDVAQFFAKYRARHIGALNKTDTDVMELYGVEGTPANFVIDREGRLASGKISGYAKGDTRIDRALKKVGLGAE